MAARRRFVVAMHPHFGDAQKLYIFADPKRLETLEFSCLIPANGKTLCVEDGRRVNSLDSDELGVFSKKPRRS